MSLFQFIVQFLKEVLKLTGAIVLWTSQRIKGNKFSFKSYVWQEGIPASDWLQIIIGFSFFVLVGLVITMIV